MFVSASSARPGLSAASKAQIRSQQDRRTERENPHMGPLPPTENQIAELHSLLAQSKTLASQINYPICAVLFSATCELAFHLLDRDSFVSFVLSYLKEASLLPTIGTIILGATSFYCIYKKLWDLISSQLGGVFPNGFGFNRNTDPAYEMQFNLSSKDKVQSAINRLTKLINEQESRKKQMFYSSLGICLLAPLTNCITIDKGEIVISSMSLALKTHVLGPFVDFRCVNSFTLPPVISTILHSQQGLQFYNCVYSLWTNKNIPKDLTHFKNCLKKLSCISSTWDTNQLIKDKASAVVSLNLMGKETVEFYDAVVDRHSVTAEAYLIELHRVLMEEDFQVYRTSSQRVFVGYNDLGEKRVRRIKIKLLECLVLVEQVEKNIDKILDKLNKINTNVRMPAEWDSYLGVDSKTGKIKIYFYLKISKVYKNILDDYLSNLSRIGEVNVKDDIITLNILPTQMEDFISSSLDLFKLPSQTIFESSSSSSTFSSSSAFTTVVPGKNRKMKTPPQPLLPVEEKNGGLNESRPEIYPKKISFGHNFIFSKADELLKPLNFAYPMHVPWWPEGYAYAALDPEIIEVIQPYLTLDRVWSVLERGLVHGRGSKSKTGAIGIQSDFQPYKNIHGKNCPVSGFKLKFPENIRIWGRKVEEITVDGKPRVLYIFDGVERGH